MNGLQDRIDSFLKAKRVKSIKKFMKWPHPVNDRSFKATPEALAEAGFYYNPSASQKDNVTCFMCNKSIGAWEEEDDPFEFHYKACGQECDWAILRCGLRRDVDRHGDFVFPDKTRLPRSKTIERARRATFKDWGHENPSPEKMAQAGFVYTPMQSGDDLATCLYCNVALSGWDPDDDPIEEHRKREARNGLCPFFHPPGGAPGNNPSTGETVTKPSSRSGSARPASRTSVKPPSRTKNNIRTPSAHQDIVQPIKTHDGDEDSDYNSTQSTTTGDRRMSRAPGKGQSKRAVSGASRSRSKGKQLADVEEEQDADELEEEIKPRGKRKTTAKSKIVSKAVEVEDDAEEPIEDDVQTVEEEVTARPKRGRGRPRKTKPVEASVESGEDAQEEPPKPKAKKKGRPTKAKAPKSEPEPEPHEEELGMDEEDVSAPAKSKTKGKGKPKVYDSEDGIADVQRTEVYESELDTRKTGTTTGKAKSRTETEDDDLGVTVVKPKRKVASKTQPKESGREDTELEPEVEKPKTKTKPASKLRSKASQEDEVPLEESIEPVKTATRGPSNPMVQKGSKKVKESDIESQHEEVEEIRQPVKPKPASKVQERISEAPVISKHDISTRQPPATIAKEEPPKQQRPSKPKNPSLFTSDPVSSAELPPSSSDAEILLDSPRSRKQSAGTTTGDIDIGAQEDIITSSDEEEVLKSLIPGQDDITTRVSAPAIMRKPSSSNLQPQVEAKQNVSPLTKRRSSGNKTVVEINRLSAVKIEQRSDSQPIQSQPPPPSPPPPRDPTPPAEDVVMQDGTQDLVTQEQAHPERFVTPPKQVRSLPVPHVVSPPPPPPQQSTTAELPPPPPSSAIEEEPVYPTPPLSLLPFTPLTALTSAELDMTVEEWIRYQIGVEYDKLKRDGMRELEKFKRKAEDVRKTIDGL